MNCPFCGTTLAKVAAICPSCKTQLPEARLFNYYAAALERDKSLAQPEKRKKLDSLVLEESVEREKLLVEAKERARLEAEREEKERARQAKEYRERQEVLAIEAKAKREEYLEKNRTKLRVIGSLVFVVVAAVIAASIIIKPEGPKPFESNDVRLEPCIALGLAAKDVTALLNLTLESNRDGGLSAADLARIRNSTEQVQANLYGQTIGQTNNLPKIEDAVLNLYSALGAFPDSLTGEMSEGEIIKKSTDPLNRIAIQAGNACKSAGLGNQFNEASGWE